MNQLIHLLRCLTTANNNNNNNNSDNNTWLSFLLHKLVAA
jgi:hypothetical protein